MMLRLAIPLLVVEMWPQFGLRNVVRRLREDRAQRALRNRVVIRDDKRLDFRQANAPQLDMLRTASDAGASA